MRKPFLPLVGIAFLGSLPSPAWAGEIRGQIAIPRPPTEPRASFPNYQIRDPSTPLPATASLPQSHQRFDPKLVIIPLCPTVSAPNADAVFHNVFSISSTREFDLGYYAAGEARAAGETRDVRFDQAGIVQVRCHLHADMNAAIFVVPTPWFRQPDPTGALASTDLPAGSYRATVWHHSASFFSRKVKPSDHRAVIFFFKNPLREGA